MVATELRQKWTRKHKAAIRTADEKRRQAWRALEGAGTDPEQTTIVPPENIDGTKADEEWKSHLYVESDGTYREDFRSSWGSRALRTELERDDVIGWLRNQDRKAWSLCVPRKQGTKWHGVYPDLIIFRQTDSGVIADVVDPHLLGRGERTWPS